MNHNIKDTSRFKPGSVSMGDNLINLLVLSLGLAGGLLLYRSYIPPIQDPSILEAMNDKHAVYKVEIARLLRSKNNQIADQGEKIDRLCESLRNMSERCDFLRAEIKMLENMDMDAAVTILTQTM
jgi:hypothetical protein